MWTGRAEEAGQVTAGHRPQESWRGPGQGTQTGDGTNNRGYSHVLKIQVLVMYKNTGYSHVQKITDDQRWKKMDTANAVQILFFFHAF